MLIIKSCSHIRKCQNIKGFHTCKHSTGAPLFHRDRGRILLEGEKLAQKRAERLWFTGQYRKSLTIRLGLK